jgi:NADH-quinone oxidoreductase subunit G
VEKLMATIHVDGRDYPADPAHNLLQACLSAGLDLPYFCWHPALGSVGACRQCAVKQYSGADDRSGRIVMACMTPAADGARISIADAETAEFRRSVIEWLMTNHPHDCPVCEEGGECHLQDMTLMSGHTYRRYRFGKRTHRNQDLGPFVKHEMNRCIACYRCVRFYRDYAGGRDLDVHAAHNDVYFGRHQDGTLENEFSGNLVEVCPTGVFTDKTLSAVYARKWDMEGAPSICVHCGLGCNTIANARDGELRRILNRYNGEVNRYFLCDRGRFGYGFVNAESRIRRPLLAQGEAAEAATGEAALEGLADLLRSGHAIGIGSPRASLESNFALRELVGPERFHAGMSDIEHRLLSVILDILRAAPAPVASLREAEACDAVFVLGEDVCDTAPRLALALRQAVRQKSIAVAAAQRVPEWQDAAVRDAARDNPGPLVLATPLPTRLDDIATQRVRAAPDDIARLGFAVAHAIDATAPDVADLSAELREAAARIAQQLAGAKRPLVVSGVASGSEAVLRAVASVARALRATGREARISFTVSECNSLGLALMGGAPLGAALDALRFGRTRTVVVLENDLFRRADHPGVAAALGVAEHVIALDHTLNETVRHAQIVLPAATFAEADGTLVNNEGRAQRFFQLLFPRGEVAESWRWLDRAATALNGSEPRWRTLDDVIGALGRALPELAPIADAAPGARFRIANLPVRSAPHRYSGRTAMHAQRSVREPIPQRNPDAPFSNTMEGYYGEMPGALYPFYWAPGWNSVQALNKFQQEVGGPLAGGDPGVRLIEPGGSPSREVAAIPPPFKRRDGEWLVIARYPIFGAEELSARAPAMASRIGAARVSLHPDDAARLGVAEHDFVELEHAGQRYRVEVELAPALAPGLAAVTAGIHGLAWMPLPAWMAIRRAPTEEPRR